MNIGIPIYVGIPIYIGIPRYIQMNIGLLV